uniref:Protein kinase domain-containing protein n=1 Tax=Ditylenchus dipsaci TaxID=166011 RepID=A0A915EUN7_9BILA
MERAEKSKEKGLQQGLTKKVMLEKGELSALIGRLCTSLLARDSWIGYVLDPRFKDRMANNQLQLNLYVASWIQEECEKETEVPASNSAVVIDQSQAIRFALDIARGMSFLHSLDQTILRFYLNSNMWLWMRTKCQDLHG